MPLQRIAVRLLPALALLLALALPGQAQFLPSTGETAETPAEAAPTPTGQLLEILKDDAARTALIEELERAAAPVPAEPAAAAAETEEPPSLGRRLALITQDAAENIADRAARTWRSLRGAGRTFSGLGGDEIPVLLDALEELLLVIVLTVAIFLVLRRIAIPFYRRMGARADDNGVFQTLLISVGSVLVDALLVVVAWAAGYALTVTAVGEFGQIGIRQTLYLNAFLAVELFKVGLRAVLSPSTSGLRPVPLSDPAARSFNRHATVAISLVGYGQLLILPIVNQNVSFAAGRGISALISVVVVLYLAVLVITKRKAVASWLVTLMAPPAPPPDPDLPDEVEALPAPAPSEAYQPPSGTLVTLARQWYWFVLLYLAVMLGIVLTRPAYAVSNALAASGKIALALIAALIFWTLLTRAISSGLSLPETMTTRLPALERRLNSFVPRILLIVRFVIVAILFLFALNATGVIAVSGWLDSELGLQVTGTSVSVALMLLIAAAIWLAMASWVDYRLNPDWGKVPTARETTLLTLLKNAATIAIIIITMMFALSEIGLDIGPLLASAGVLGLAIGFGAQKMVQDIITGIFVQFENAINVGDVITVAGTTGVVEKLTVRSVSLRDVHGVFHLIPFSSVDLVSNFTREFSYFVCDMGVAYRENTDEAKQAMHDAFDALRRHPDQGGFIVGNLEWFGLNSFGASEVVLRARIKTQPGKQWGVGRAYNEIVKRIFDERNIEIPFPHQTIYFGERKDGTTQTLQVAAEPTDAETATG